MKRLSLICLCISSLLAPLKAQSERVQRMPYADHYRYYVGLQLGLEMQGIRLYNAGYHSGGQALYAEQAPYQLGIGVGITAGLRLRPNWELRLMPSLHLGNMSICYTDGTKPIEYIRLSSSYLSLALQGKWASDRLNNIRPYLALGPYLSWHFASKREDLLRRTSLDAGLLLSVGCEVYLGFIRVSPELSYGYSLCEGLRLSRPELESDPRLRYTSAISSSRGHYIGLSLHFQ